jgi:hypothetical protein
VKPDPESPEAMNSNIVYADVTRMALITQSWELQVEGDVPLLTPEFFKR